MTGAVKMTSGTPVGVLFSDLTIFVLRSPIVVVRFHIVVARRIMF